MLPVIWKRTSELICTRGARRTAVKAATCLIREINEELIL